MLGVINTTKKNEKKGEEKIGRNTEEISKTFCI